MKDRILAKMEAHVKSIIDKPIITNEDYALISSYLTKLELDEQKEESKRRTAESQEQFKSALAMLGGASYGV